MNIYFICFITITIILCLWCAGRHTTTLPEKSLVEPFTRQFFRQIKPTYFIGIDQSQLFGNEFQLIETVSRMMPFNINKLMVEKSMDRYKHLNDDKIQLILSRANELFNVLYKTTSFFAGIDIPHLRFVCAMHSVPVNILTTELWIDELAFLKGSKLTVNVGPKNSYDYFIAVDLFLQYKIIVGQDIYLTYYDVNELYKHYGEDVQVAFISRTHPDKNIVDLVNKELTKFVDILKYNDGNIYRVSLDEEPFYKEYPYYSKSLLEKDKLKGYYTNLVTGEEIFNHHSDRPITSYRSHFISTISIKYYLLSNDFTKPSAIKQLLYNMKLNMHQINQLEFIDEALNTSSLTDFTLPIPVHQGAADFYTSAGLYTNLDNPNCLMINGRCDEKQLSEHHIDNKLGPTFNQLFNT